ncbi:conserved hypothetical protein [Tenacibaculum litopenaei]|uniref:hypothetical protein n=1 Tax=Tenacibaculum litopenaei TaxID=396016 RepID=UPI003893D659
MKVIAYAYRLIYPALMVVFYLILERGVKLEPRWLRIAIAIGVAYFLSPKVKSVKTETGYRKQLTWVFLKEPIFLD